MKNILFRSCISFFVAAIMLNSEMTSAETPDFNAFSQFLKMQKLNVHSENQEKHQDNDFLIPKKNKWVTINQTFGSEKVTVKFPKKPSIEKKDGAYFAGLEVPAGAYSFMAPYPPIGLISHYELFESFRSAIAEQMPEAEIVEALTVNFDRTIFELYAYNIDHAVYKTKIIVTSKNFYVIGVAYLQEKENSSHGQFLNSISIKDK